MEKLCPKYKVPIHPLPTTAHSFCNITILHLFAMFVASNEPILIHYYLLKSPQFTLGFTLLSCTVLQDPPNSIGQNSYTAVKTLCAPPIPLPSSAPDNHNLFSLHNYTFSKMAHNWNHTVCGPFRLASLT